MEEEMSLSQGQGSRLRLYLAVLSVNLLYVSCGTVTAWASPILPKLADTITEEQGALIGSLYSFGAAFGPIVAALCLDTIGRKGTLYVLSSSYIISWILLAISYNIYVLYIGRIIGGLGVGGSFSSGCVLIAEIADTKSRGSVGSLNMASFSLGLLIEYCIGPWTEYRTLVIISAIPIILFLVTFFFIPESPYYLLIKERKSEAVESLRWYRGNIKADYVQNELSQIQESIQARRNNQTSISALFQRGQIKALGISIYVLILQQSSGSNALLGFAQKIFAMGNVALSGPICAIIGGATLFLAAIPTPFVLRKFSMKWALVSSTYGVAVSLAVLALYFYFEGHGYDVSSVSFLPILAYIGYNIFLCLGCGPLPWAIVAELFTAEVKGLATCICGIISSLTGFAVIEISGIMLTRVGVDAVFAGFCIFVAVLNTGVMFLVPNTKGLSLQEIHEHLDNGKQNKEKSVEDQ